MSKSDAKDWWAEQKAVQDRKSSLDEQSMALYAAAKYTRGDRNGNFPSPGTLMSLGFPEVAIHVNRAYGLLRAAKDLFDQQMLSRGE